MCLVSDTFHLPFTEQACCLQAQELFETHHFQQFNHFYPKENRVNLQTQPTVECHTEAPTVTFNLHQLLQFGVILDQSDFNDLVNHCFEDIVKACSKQLLFWHISGSVA